jgi:hypothetical protein
MRAISGALLPRPLVILHGLSGCGCLNLDRPTLLSLPRVGKVLSGYADIDWRRYWLSQTLSLKAVELGEGSTELASQIGFVA